MAARTTARCEEAAEAVRDAIEVAMDHPDPHALAEDMEASQNGLKDDGWLTNDVGFVLTIGKRSFTVTFQEIDDGRDCGAEDAGEVGSERMNDHADAG